MALVRKDRVKETTTTTGTGALALGGAATGFQPFSVIGVGNTCEYAIEGPGGVWETGLGTLSAATTLQRTTVYESSASGAKVDLPAGAKTVFLTIPAFALNDLSPSILPIALVTPAAGETGVGAGGTYTFTVRAFVGDTVGFYSDYGIPVATRTVRIYEPGGSAPVKTFAASGAGASLVVDMTASGLATSHAYEAEWVYADAKGNTVTSGRVGFTTAAQFRTTEGQADNGGFKAFNDFGDGELMELLIAPKSTEASRQFYFNTSSNNGALSRLNGRLNTDALRAQDGTVSTLAAPYANSIIFGGVAGHLGAIDELRAISAKLRPNAAPAGTPFVAGGSEAFGSSDYHSSTEFDGGTSFALRMDDGSNGTAAKTTNKPVRAIRRRIITGPIPLGTYVAAQGGWLAAYFTDLSSGTPQTFGLFVSDKAVEVARVYSTISENPIAITQSRTNGFSSNQIRLSTDYPAGNYCWNLVHGGKDDWYLGAIDEMLAIARMNDRLPSAQRLTFASLGMWSSTEIDANSARIVNNAGTGETNQAKTSNAYVRPIRRVPLAQLAA